MIKKENRFTYIKNYRKTKYLYPSCMICIDKIPVGSIVSESKAKIIVEWLNSVDEEQLQEDLNLKYD